MKKLIQTLLFMYVVNFIYCTNAPVADNSSNSTKAGFSPNDLVVAQSQMHRSILITWKYHDSTSKVAHYKIYRSTAFFLDSLNDYLPDTSETNFTSVGDRANVDKTDSSFVDIIDLEDAIYWYGVKVIFVDSSSNWIGFDSAIVRNVYEYNPFVTTSSTSMKNVLLFYGKWISLPRYVNNLLDTFYYYVDFDTSQPHNSLLREIYLPYWPNSYRDYYEIGGFSESSVFQINSSKDTVTLNRYSQNEAKYALMYNKNGSLNMSKPPVIPI